MEPKSLLKLLRPSASKRWLFCPGSVGLQLAHPDKCPDGSSSFAEEGTLAHATAEAMLKHLPMPEGLASVSAEVREEILGHAADYAALVMREVNADTRLEVEYRVPLFYAGLLPPSADPADALGTCDALVWNLRENTLHIFDLKYGKGVPVHAEGNTQLIIYALSAVLEMRDLLGLPERVIMTIYQPRCNDGEPAERTVEMLWGDMSEWLHRIDRAVRVFANGGAALESRPSNDACRFCPCAGFCAARANELLGDLPVSDGDEPVAASPEALTTEALLAIMRKADAITKLLKDVDAYLLDRAVSHGESLPGWKVVEGVKCRVWTDEAAALARLKELTQNRTEGLVKTSLVTPAQAESFLKKLGRKDLAAVVADELTTKPQGGPQLAPATDKRPEFKPTSAAKEFQDVED